MTSGQSFDDFLAEELANEPELAQELDETFADVRLAVQLAMCREKRGMSQQALAHVTGIQQPMISRIERGDQEPTWPTLRKLLRGLRANLVAGPDGEVTVTPTEEAAVPLSATEVTVSATEPDAQDWMRPLLASPQVHSGLPDIRWPYSTPTVPPSLAPTALLTGGVQVSTGIERVLGYRQSLAQSYHDLLAEFQQHRHREVTVTLAFEHSGSSNVVSQGPADYPAMSGPQRTRSTQESVRQVRVA